jgi:hypothetical protein
MASDEKFKARLARLGRWVNRVSQVWQRALSQSESDYLNLVRDLESEKSNAENALKMEEERVRAALDQAGKDFVKAKYHYEKEGGQSRSDIERMDLDIQKTKQHLASELARLNQEKVNNQVSFERQKSALNDLYNEKKRQLLVMREKMVREHTQAESTLKHQKEKQTRELQAMRDERERSIQHVKNQLASKQEGWAVAVLTMQKELDALVSQKTDLEKQLNSLHSEKEREIQNIHLQIEVGKEQMDLDKATLIEQAEADQRRLESEVQSFQEKVAVMEKELQNLILDLESQKSNLETGFSQEEKLLADTLKNESEKRDFDQKLFAQEKSMKEKDLSRLREEFDKKKAQWDNQIKTLLMQKSLKDAEHEAERARVDREARVMVRSLEAKRDELKQRLSEIQSRTEANRQNSQKEIDLLKQRWQWRKDRLWSMWQSRLDLLKKERGALQAQLEQVASAFNKERQTMQEESQKGEGYLEELRQGLVLEDDRTASTRRQRNIQIELEKTRVIAQIKECETLVSEWEQNQKQSHAQFLSRKGAFVDDIEFLDRYYRAQQDETQVFLSTFQKALDLFKGQLERFGMRQDAA